MIKLSTKDKMYRALLSGKTITVKSGRRRFGVSNVTARIAELRQEGYDIRSRPSTNKGLNGRPFAVYYMKYSANVTKNSNKTVN